MRRALAAVAIVAILPSCAGRVRSVAVVADTAITQAIVGLADTEAIIFETRTAAASRRHTEIDWQLGVLVNGPERDALLAERADVLRAQAERDQQHRRFNAKMVQITDAALAFNAAIRAWDGSTPMPDEVPALTDRVRELLDELLDLWVDDETKSAVMSKVALVQQAIITFLLVRGGAA